MTQAWPIVVDSPQGHGSWPDGLIPRPEQSAVSLGILHECREGKLSFSLRAAELGLCKTGTISDPKLPLSFCLGKCLIGGIMKLIHREKPSSDWRGWGDREDDLITFLESLGFLRSLWSLRLQGKGSHKDGIVGGHLCHCVEGACQK